MSDKSHKGINRNSEQKPYVSQGKIQTEIERLRFVIDFAQAELRTTRPGDMVNLRDDLNMFARAFRFSSYTEVKPGGGAVFTGPPTSAHEISDEAVQELQGKFLEVLRKIIGPLKDPERIHEIGDIPDIQYVRFHAKLDDDKHLFIFPASDYPALQYYRLFQLLDSPANLRRLRVCPGCDQIFLKFKRQKYCSQTCANRTYMQQYRAAHSDAARKANEISYDNRIKKRTGKNVKVRHRSEKENLGVVKIEGELSPKPTKTHRKPRKA